jgi:uncharacterized protein with von Willebrand factor type A (vWA) domain
MKNLIEPAPLSEHYFKNKFQKGDIVELQSGSTMFIIKQIVEKPTKLVLFPNRSVLVPANSYIFENMDSGEELVISFESQSFFEIVTPISKEKKGNHFWNLPQEEQDKGLCYDVSKWQKYTWQNILEEDPNLSAIEWKGKEKLKEFSELSAEIFHTINSYNPRPLEKLSKKGKEIKKLHEDLQANHKFREIREKCKGNNEASSIAMSHLLSLVEGNITSKNGTKKEDIKKLQEELQRKQQILDNAKYFNAEPTQERIKKEILDLRKDISQLKNQNKKGAISVDEITKNFSKQANVISQKINDSENIIQCLSDLAGKGGRASLKELKIKQGLINDLMQNKEIKKAFELAGRYKRIVHSKIREKSTGVSEVVGITQGNDLQRLLPSELLLLATEETKPLFFKKFFEGNLMQYKRKDKQAKGKGPIRLLVDVSGSMNGAREQYAGAVAFALLTMAAKEKRHFELWHFDTKIQSKYRYTKEDSIQKQIQHFLHPKSGGGTSIQNCLEIAIKETSNKKANQKMDIVLITDGRDKVHPIAITKLKNLHDVKLFSIMCDYQDNNFLKECSDVYINMQKNGNEIDSIFEGVMNNE